MNKISLILADDHPLFRKGLYDVITEQKDLSLLGEARDGERALELIQQHKPSIAVLDIDMPKLSGLDVAAQVAKEKIPTEVIVLTMHDDSDHFDKAMEIGVSGYLVKDSAAETIIDCIRSVAAGKTYVSPILSHHLIKKQDKAKAGIAARLGISQLTPTERTILKLISQSKSTKQIASQLYISTKTVSAHRSNICGKLNLHGTNALLKFALENKALL